MNFLLVLGGGGRARAMIDERWRAAGQRRRASGCAGRWLRASGCAPSARARRRPATVLV